MAKQGLTNFVDKPGGKPSLELRQPQQPKPGAYQLPSDVMLEDDYKEPYTAWKANPTPETRRAVVQSVQPVIEKGLTSYGGNKPSPVLRSRARLMAAEAIDRYDPARSKLQTHLLSHLRGLHRHAAKEGELISVPERVKMQMMSVRKAEKELEDRLGREPLQEELTEYTGLSAKRLEYVMQAASPVMAAGYYDSMAEGNESMDMTPEVQNDDAAAWVDFVYQDLGKTDKLILDSVLGRHGKKKIGTREIAKKMRLSPGAISQRLAKIQEKLDKREELGLGL